MRFPLTLTQICINENENAERTISAIPFCLAVSFMTHSPNVTYFRKKQLK